ncbi:hypothetical protein KM043_016257 [Ampulex compressa]|nr:hypothetical protein KM043_016257 [Ampulex compressa]
MSTYPQPRGVNRRRVPPSEGASSCQGKCFSGRRGRPIDRGQNSQDNRQGSTLRRAAGEVLHPDETSPGLNSGLGADKDGFLAGCPPLRR